MGFAKDELKVPYSAVILENEITENLNRLLLLEVNVSTHPEFKIIYQKVLTLLSKYQNEIIKNSEYESSCSLGCSKCCNHWVEDVNSFEIELIGEYLEKNYPEKISSICSIFREDEKLLEHINNIMEKKLAEEEPESELNELDHTDLLLASYYQLERPCALLNKYGECSIYEVRPITCRIYFNFSGAEMCKPSFINDPDIPTYLVDVKEKTNLILDKLHEKFKRFESTGLRSALLEYFA